jgi:hypothetical protein
LITLVLVVGPSATAAEVTATRLDGGSTAGGLRGWDHERISVATAQGEVIIPTDQLVSLRWKRENASDAPKRTSSGLVELTNGTLLPARQVVVTGSKVAITTDAPLQADEEELIVPVRQVASVQLRPLEGPLVQQWEEIHANMPASDVLVVPKRDGTSLDYVEGVLGAVTPEKIEFKHGDQPIRIDRAKVAGFIYYRKERNDELQPRCIIHGSSGLRANASRVQLSDGMVSIATAGIEISWPVDDLNLADFSAGKIKYLSDIEQVSARWMPLVGLPAGASQVAEYGQPRRDQSAYGGPLTLLYRDTESSGDVGRSQAFNKGLALRSRTEMVFRLPPGYRRFTALAGVEPATVNMGNVHLAIYGDDRPLFDADVAGDQAPHRIELDIAEVKRLKIVVDFGQNLDTGDWLNLCDARLVR